MPGFGRVPHLDPRSLNYPIRPLLTATRPRSYTWRCLPHLDQGHTSTCVGHAWAHENAARPLERHSTSALAFALYARAQQLDEWPGEAYDGTSVLGGAKAMQEKRLLREYRWAFNVDDLLVAVSHHGPAVLGVDWREGMMDPDPDGYLHATGPVVGGHAILCRGVSLRRGAVLLHNSWGASWGQQGTAWLPIPDLTTLLAHDGEACIPTAR